MSDDQQKKLADLRSFLASGGVDAYIIPHADEYQNEFLPARAERLKYITGFSGSAGAAVVTQSRAMVQSDARYTIQLKAQCGASFECEDSTQTPLAQWLAENMEAGQTAGFDPALVTLQQYEDWQAALAEKGVTLKPIAQNYVDQIWADQPAAPNTIAQPLPENIAGLNVAQKCAQLFDYLAQEDLQAMLLTAPEDVAWLLNLRANDLAYTPVKLARILIDATARRCALFVDDPASISGALQASWPDYIAVQPAANLQKAFKTLASQHVALDKANASLAMHIALEEADAFPAPIKNPIPLWRAQKTPQEIAAIKETHRLDGLALVKFSHWLSRQNPDDLDEIAIENQLEAYRVQCGSYKGKSFPTIAGFGPNGAIVHYRATQQSYAQCSTGHLLLLDSGGQYMDAAKNVAGTTDITRTYALGDPQLISDDIKTHYTLVLKGNIALSMAQFEKGTTGLELDQYARTPLQENGLNYAHGTGHGVGCYLAVHEWAASISPRGKDAMLPGMLISNEPGYYEEGSHGIRIENLVLCVEEGQNLAFETITLCPIETSLIVERLLSAEEADWLNAYHKRVYETLAPDLDAETKAWLKQATRPL